MSIYRINPNVNWSLENEITSNTEVSADSRSYRTTELSTTADIFSTAWTFRKTLRLGQQIPTDAHICKQAYLGF